MATSPQRSKVRADGNRLEDLLEIVSVQLGRAEVRPEDRFIEDLGAESADLINLAASIDDRFGVFVDEEALVEVRTVADLQRLVFGKPEE